MTQSSDYNHQTVEAATLRFGLQHPDFTFDNEGPKIVERPTTLTQKAESWIRFFPGT